MRGPRKLPFRGDMRVQVKTTALALGATALIAIGGRAQPGPAQRVPAPRALGSVVARTTQPFAAVPNLFSVPGGVFVHDAGSRQLWLFDAVLMNARVVLDSTSGLGKMAYYGPPLYGGRPNVPASVIRR